MKLDGKVAIVTGGGSGIGKAIAVRYAEEGAHVVIVGRREAVLKETAALDDKISYVAGDITQDEVIDHIIKTVKDKFGHLDILVNNAGWCRFSQLLKLRLKTMIKLLVWMFVHL